MEKELEAYKQETFDFKDNIYTEYINPKVELLGYFPEIKKYTDRLGDEPVDVVDKYDTRTVIFPGGKVEYENSDKQFQYGPIHPRNITIYGTTVEPGVRAMNTEGFDTNILFYIVPVNDGEPVYKKNGKYKERIILLNNELALVMIVKEPVLDKSNIKDWWKK